MYTDLTGPINVGKDGYRFAVIFVNNHSLYFLGGEKSDTLKTTENFLADNSSFVIVKRLRTDNGTEYKSSNFRSLMAKSKTIQFSAPYSPYQKGTAERP